jgi:hypothetical protein
MDQTPLAFEFLSSKTFNCKGAKTIWLKEARSGWSRRKCTLQVCVYADGVQRCDPLILFEGAEKGDYRRGEEAERYAKGVDVLWNPAAWANEKTMLWWLRHPFKLSSAYRHVGVEKEPRLLCLDAFAAHLTPTVRSYIRQNRTTLSVILGGCTGYV